LVEVPAKAVNDGTHYTSNLHCRNPVHTVRAERRKIQTMKKQKDPSLFDVHQYKCWMFPSHRSDARNAETMAREKELRRIKYEAKYPPSNAKEVEL
jgi:hypothetical protein